MMKKVVIPFVVLLCLSGCQEKLSFDIEKEDLIGDWRSSDELINGESTAELTDYPFTASATLWFRSEELYWLDYMTGTWSLEGDKLNLDPVRKYTILSYTGDQLVVESMVTESAVWRDLPAFETDEEFLYTQTFTRY